MDASNICKYIDNDLIHLIHNIVLLIKIAVPVVLVILGMIDFAKGVIASKEDEIKKGQQTFFKRVIAAIIVFFVVTIVQLLMSFISSDDSSIWTCANQILNGVPNAEVENNNGNVDKGNAGSKASNKNSGGVSADENVSCSSELYYKEFNGCLKLVPNLANPHEVCASYFQEVCTSQINSPIWETDNSYSSDKIKNVACTLSDGSNSELLRKQVYSCAKYNEGAGVSLDDAVNMCLNNMPAMSNYCKKK